MSTLEKAISQTTLTRDTVEEQFCSDWLKDQIIELFDQLEEAKIDALKFGRAMEEERNLRLALQRALEELTDYR